MIVLTKSLFTWKTVSILARVTLTTHAVVLGLAHVWWLYGLRRLQWPSLTDVGKNACHQFIASIKGSGQLISDEWACADVTKDVGSISIRMFEAFLATVLGKWVLAALFYYFYVQACFWLLTNVGGVAAFVLFGLLTWALMAVAGWVFQKFRT